MLDSILGAAVQGAATGAAAGLTGASAVAQGNQPLVGHLRAQAIARIAVWLALAAWALVRATNIVTGAGRDIAFREMTISAGTQAAGIAIAAGAAALCVLAAWRTYVVERKAPPPGTLWFPGYRLPLFGEWVLAVTGGLLLLVGIWGFTTIPESLAAGQDPRFRNYHSASATPALIWGSMMAGIGWLCMIARRSRWDLAPGQPLVRRAITAFSRPKPAGSQIALQWEGYWVGTGVMRRLVAWSLRGVVDKRRSFQIAFAPLNTSVDHRLALAEAWRQRFAALGPLQVTAIDPGGAA